MAVRFPTTQNRTTIIGPTGSGKTVFGIWLLGTRKTLDWRAHPVIIFDFKGDDLVEEIDPIECDIKKHPPKKPGLYVVRPMPHQVGDVELFLWRCWKQENIGLFFDEGYMVAKSNALNAILTQGRSKHIPVIMLLQRPVWAPRFCFSEAQYFAVFNIFDKRDANTVTAFVNADVGQHRLPYHCLWYDVAGNAGRGEATIFSPVPKIPEIVAMFAEANVAVKKRVV